MSPLDTGDHWSCGCNHVRGQAKERKRALRNSGVSRWIQEGQRDDRGHATNNVREKPREFLKVQKTRKTSSTLPIPFRV